MKYKFILATLVLSLSTAAMAGGAQDAINAAKKAQKEAQSIGFEWTNMGKLIKKAEKAAKAGDDKKAIKLAKTVSTQLVAIKQQAALAKTAGPTF